MNQTNNNENHIDLSDIYEKLKAPFPNEAYSSDNSRGFQLTSLKAQYIVERMNDVFGLGNWSLNGEFEKDQHGIIFHGVLTAIAKGRNLTMANIGFSPYKPKHMGDAYKSARTDCLSKCASWLGVGNEVFKGNIKLSDNQNQKNNNYGNNNNKNSKCDNRGNVYNNNSRPKIDSKITQEMSGLLLTYTSHNKDKEAVKELMILFKLKNSLRELYNRSEYGQKEVISTLKQKLTGQRPKLQQVQ